MEVNDSEIHDELRNIYKQIDSLDNTLTNILNIMKLNLAFNCGLISISDIAKQLVLIKIRLIKKGWGFNVKYNKKILKSENKTKEKLQSPHL